MTVIKQDDLIQSVADALQFISYYHPVDFIRALTRAYEKEQSPAARDAPLPESLQRPFPSQARAPPPLPETACEYIRNLWARPRTSQTGARNSNLRHSPTETVVHQRKLAGPRVRPAADGAR